MSTTTYAILAGGSGTRFWPAGRKSRPKQLLPLDGDDPRPLLTATYERLLPLGGTPWIVAPADFRAASHELLPAARFLAEPAARNTAPAVALIAFAAQAEHGDDPVVVLPADHHVAPEAGYRQVLADMAARATISEAIITLGLEPERPATGYGYLEKGEQVETLASGAVHVVARYVEKPDETTAREMISSGRFLWNAGTFAFRPSVFLRELASSMPETHDALASVFADHAADAFGEQLAEAYEGLPSISVDYGVMEKAARVETLAASFSWDDLGSWDAVARHRSADAHGNHVRGDLTIIDSRGCVVDAVDGHVALLGVDDLIVVRTGDTVLVAKRGRGEDVRQIVDALKSAGRDDLLS